MTPEQLKASILQRAMEGKLVPQNPNDEPASELLKRIKAEKEKLISEGKIKRDKKETEIFRGDDGKHYEKFADGSTQEIDVPYDIPENWEWVRVKDVTITNPKNNMNDDSLTSFLPMKLISDGYSTNHSFEIKKWGDIKKGFTHFQNKDVILAKITPCFQNRKSTVLTDLEGGMGAGTTEIYTFRTLSSLLSEFLLYIFKTQDFISAGIKNFSGTAGQQRVPRIFVENYCIPLPPLSEQKRIVKAIEEALAKVDEYAESYNRLEQLDKEFPDKLKKSILQYAMQGKLVEQDPNDKSVEVLLEKIRAEKQKLFEEGKIKKKDLEIPIVSQGDDNSYYEEVPYEIPKSWEWVRFSTLVEIVRGGSPRPIKDYLTSEVDGINWIKIGDTEKGEKYINNVKEKIKKSGLNKTRFVKKGTFLLTNSMSFGRPYILNVDGAIHDGWLAISNYENSLNRDYLFYILSSNVVYSQFLYLISGAVVKNLNSDKVASILIPLPPLSEQTRIVDKIEQSFAHIDALI